MSDTDQARRNAAYVRRLLRQKQPEYATILESVIKELKCQAPSTK
jgi:hypothetical protein